MIFQHDGPQVSWAALKPAPIKLPRIGKQHAGIIEHKPCDFVKLSRQDFMKARAVFGFRADIVWGRWHLLKIPIPKHPTWRTRL